MVRRGNAWSAAPNVSWPGCRLLHEPSTVRRPNESSGLGDLIRAVAEQRAARAGQRRRVGDVGLGDLDLLEDEREVGRGDRESLADGCDRGLERSGRHRQRTTD